MRSIIIMAFVCLFAVQVSAQVKKGLFIGPQMTGAKYRVQGVDQETSMKGGFQLGAKIKSVIEGNLSFAPSLFYSMKGYKVTYNRFQYPPDATATSNNTTFHNVETAFLLQVDFGKNEDHFYIKGGPSLDFQLFGNEKFETPTGTVDRKIPFGYDKYGHFSANAILALGYEWANGFFVFGHYTHGLANISNTDNGPVIKHNAVGISIGKYLSK